MNATKESIITLPDPRLRQKSRRVGHIDAATRQLALDMIAATVDWEIDREHEVGVALAAVQIGVLDRVVIIRNNFENKDDHSFAVFINPEIVKTEGDPTEDMEGCLSVTSTYGKVARYPKVKIKALNLDGQIVRLTATDFLARVFQHEIDHTNGFVFLDRLIDPSERYRLEADGTYTRLGADPSAETAPAAEVAS